MLSAAVIPGQGPPGRHDQYDPAGLQWKGSKYIQPHNITIPNNHPSCRRPNERNKSSISKESDAIWDNNYADWFNDRLDIDDVEGASKI